MTKIKQGDLSAREEFVMYNLRLVLSIVQRFSPNKNNTDDIFQVGIIGLIKSIDNFEFYFTFIDSDDWLDSFESDIITINP